MAEELRYTDRHKRYYKMRKETIERVFADAKEKHGMRYTRYTGLAQVTNWVKLKFAAMNLKKFAIKKWEDTHNLLQILIFCPKYVQTPVLPDAKLGFLDGLRRLPRQSPFHYLKIASRSLPSEVGKYNHFLSGVLPAPNGFFPYDNPKIRSLANCGICHK